MANRKLSATERFVSKYRVNPVTECWEWTASRNHKGYGFFWTGARVGVAHRVSYELHRGEIPDGLLVMHKCDNRRCVNPEHLLVGSYADNALDAHAKGRGVIGTTHGMSKLSPDGVREIRRMRASRVQLHDIAKRFGVTKSCIWSVLTGQTWGHVK